MITVQLSADLEAAVISAAGRHGLSVDAYLATVCTQALMLEQDRARVQSFVAGEPGVAHDRADAWLAELAAGKRSACPR
ncbi:MAG TPA: hypothetical protein VJ752_21080 [Burkholderiaceae bacterium]|nr:hypothetical protein [Burkholderiaceae bacterium]